MKFVAIVFALLAIIVNGGKLSTAARKVLILDDAATTITSKTGPNPACLKADADLTTVVDEDGFCQNFSEVEDSLIKSFLPDHIQKQFHRINKDHSLPTFTKTSCQDLRRSLKCWVDPIYGCNAKKFRDTCRTSLKKVNVNAQWSGKHANCPACLCDEICEELDGLHQLDKLLDQLSTSDTLNSIITLIKLHLFAFVAALIAFEILSIFFCYYCCPAQCCRSTYWLCCCFPLCPWCCFEEYCECCPCCRPCLICCLPNCCGDPPKRSYAGVELGRR